MSLLTMTIFGGILAVLIILAGILVVRAGPADTSGQRLFFFLTAVGIFLILAVLVIPLLSPTFLPPGAPAFLLSGTSLGVLTLIVLNLKLLKDMSVKERRLALSLLAVLGLVYFLTRNDNSEIFIWFIPLALLLFAGWSLRNWKLLPVVTGLLLPAVLSLEPLSELLARLGEPLNIPAGYIAFALTGLTPALTAASISGGLKRLGSGEEGSQREKRAARIWAVLWMLPGLLLPAALAYRIFWASIWDQTSDGLAGLFFSMLAGMAAIASGMLLAVRASGLQRKAGVAFIFVFPAIMYAAFQVGWGVSYHNITDRRAVRIQNALKRYYSRHGRYPQALNELVPGQLLAIQGPVIFRGEEWCYQGGETGYRLGAVYREFFSSPLSIRIYASSGDFTGETWECEQRLASLEARHQVFPMPPEGAPTPIPQPTSQVSIPRVPVSLHAQVRGVSIRPGTWSPDGEIWMFGFSGGNSYDAPSDLAFLEAGDGNICHTEVQVPSEMDSVTLGAWLLDGRLMFVSASGEAGVLRPCEPGVEILDTLPAGIQIADSRHPEGRWVLLKNTDTYWILDGSSLEAYPVEEITPNPYEFHWDRFAWSPGGGRLAIARLNGQDASQDSTIYLISAGSGEVQAALPVKDASNQSAPAVEFLSEDELLLHGQGRLIILDFSTSPLQTTDVMRDLFSLDLDYPGAISAAGSYRILGEEGYHLVVRTNHPRNQAVHLYHSQDNRVEILHPSTHALLLLPDGEAVGLPRLESSPEAGDAYELYWAGAGSQEPIHLDVEGHLPREYPGLSLQYLPHSSRLAVASQQGVSLIALPQGELLRFWDLAEGSGINPYVFTDPDERALIVMVEERGLYWIPLDD